MKLGRNGVPPGVPRAQKRRKHRLRLAVFVALPLGCLFGSLLVGRYWLSPPTVLQALVARALPLGHSHSDAAETIVFQIRLPRALLAMLVGASLSISGVAFQGMFRNPLVSSELLGVSAGAGFGAALAILISGNPVLIQSLAFLFGVLAVGLAYGISRVYRTTPVLMLVLSGIVVSSFFAALISLATYVADPYTELPAIVFWLLGSLTGASPEDVLTAAPMMLLGMIGLLLVRWKLNLLSMGDEEARALGVDTERLKLFVIVCASLVTAAAVSVSGMIGWVGLVIPHASRMLVGPDHRVLLPVSLSLGATYLLVIDAIARTATPAELPLSVLTAVIGAPLFAILLKRINQGWA